MALGELIPLVNTLLSKHLTKRLRFYAFSYESFVVFENLYYFKFLIDYQSYKKRCIFKVFSLLYFNEAFSTFKIVTTVL